MKGLTIDDMASLGIKAAKGDTVTLNFSSAGMQAKVETPVNCLWLIAKDKSLAMPILPKCGSTSLKTFDGFLPQVSVKDALDVDKRIAWRRHPIARLHSVWQESYMRNTDGTFRWMLAHTKNEKDIPTWEEFVDLVLDGVSNTHWNPQVPQLTYQRKYVPTVTERFENLASRFNNYLPGAIRCANRSDSLPADLCYRVRCLEDKYRSDVDLWESIN